MVGRAETENQAQPWMSPTYMQAQKLRRDGSRSRFIGLVDFNARIGRYVDDFQIGTGGGGTFKPLSISDWPYWARRQLYPTQLPLDAGGRR